MSTHTLREVDFSVRGRELRLLARDRTADMRWCARNRKILRAIRSSNLDIFKPKKQKILATILLAERRS